MRRVVARVGVNLSHGRRMSSSDSLSEPTDPSARPLFDTYEVCKELKSEGFTEKQSIAVMRLIDRSLKQMHSRISSDFLSRTSYTGDQHRQWAELEQTKRHMLILEKTDIFSLRNELQQIKVDLKGMHTGVEKDISKLEGGQKLDQSLLKAHVTQELGRHMEALDAKLTAELEKNEHHASVEMRKESATMRLDAYKTIVALMFTMTTMLMTYLRFFPPEVVSKPDKTTPTPPAAPTPTPIAAPMPVPLPTPVVPAL
eukprot:Rhum_TRINITY_DN11277_c0_g1::Rhum_TRINITY_DN11277_c0_g1_i1::g.43663::m.43663